MEKQVPEMVPQSGCWPKQSHLAQGKTHLCQSIFPTATTDLSKLLMPGSQNLLEQQYFIGDIELMLDKGQLPAICVLIIGARDLQPLIIYFNYIPYLRISEKGNMLCQPKSITLLHVDLEGLAGYSLREKQLLHI